ncbi:MAG: hypothetical protein ICV58_07715 [Rubrobacteraceae bacterium]|jgi:hypothetical protein|nr:hypothetical protein [Rubrobacteraceae bacterium]
MVIEQVVRILTAIFWVASDEGLEIVNAVLMGTVMVSSGLKAADNPALVPNPRPCGGV